MLQMYFHVRKNFSSAHTIRIAIHTIYIVQNCYHQENNLAGVTAEDVVKLNNGNAYWHTLCTVRRMSTHTDVNLKLQQTRKLTK